MTDLSGKVVSGARNSVKYHLMSDVAATLTELTKEPKIAYFSMEIGVHNDIPTYSGGLGVLAGDTIRSSADLKLPLIAVTLLTKKGYFTQDISESGWQLEHPTEWDPAEYMQLVPYKTTVQIEGSDVGVQAWLYNVQSLTGG